MVYGFVKQSGGHVKICSEVGSGTRIIIYLPHAARQHAPAIAASEDNVERTSGCESILVVEDDSVVRQIAVKVLQDLGYRVSQACDGKNALDILKSADRFDLLFTDMVMPNGISGGDLIRAARQLCPGMKVLLASGYPARFAEGHEALDAQVRIVNKPYRREMLAAAVRGALNPH
jgi:CheY-like chemotaxis protein